MIHLLLLTLVSACQNVRKTRKRFTKEIDREMGHLNNATQQANSLWGKLNRLVIQGETDSVIRKVSSFYIGSETPCIFLERDAIFEL